MQDRAAYDEEIRTHAHENGGEGLARWSGIGVSSVVHPDGIT